MGGRQDAALESFVDYCHRAQQGDLNDIETEIKAQLEEEGTPKLIPVLVNAWEITCPQEIERAITKRVFSCWGIQRIGGWWLKPCYAFWRNMAGRLRRVQVQAPSSGIEVEQESLPVPVRRSRIFERLGRHLKMKGMRLVLILDEVDRCESAVAQAVPSVLIRSIIGPGIGVVVARVPTQMRDKLMNPVRLELPDIRDSAFAVLYAAWLDSSSDFDSGDGNITGRLALAGEINKVADGLTSSLASAGESDPVQRFLSARSLLDQRLNVELTNFYFTRNRLQRERIDKLFVERLMPDGAIKLSGLVAADIGAIINGGFSPRLNELLDEWRLWEIKDELPYALLATWEAFEIQNKLTAYSQGMQLRSFFAWVNDLQLAQPPDYADKVNDRLQDFLLQLYYTLA